MKHSTLATLLLPALCLFACDDGGGDGGGGGGDMGVVAQQTALFGRVTDVDGAPVSGATVTAGAATATTGADGRFQTRIGAGEVVVRIEATGYLPQIRAATVLDGQATAVETRLMREAAAVPLDATAGGQADGARGARVIVPPAALVGPDGSPIDGMVDVHLTPIDPSVPAQLDAAPGDLTARDAGGATVKLESFGMLDITMRQGGATLDVAPGQMIQIHIPAPMGGEDPPAEMPLWSFDEDTATWVEEGTLTYDADAAVYVGEITHMSFWNADRPQETACITGFVVDGAGDPVPGALVTSRGVDYSGYDSAHAGGDGRFIVYARVSSTVDVLASHGQGGVERTIETNNQLASQPADPEDCVDGGTWTIERGVVQFSDGTVVDCDPEAILDFADCIPLLVEIGECHSPMGACMLDEGGGLFSLDYSYENGARVETSIDSETFSVTTTFYGPDGVECGQQAAGAQNAMGGQVTATLPDGRSETYQIGYGLEDRSVTYTCSDGSTRTLTADDQAVLQACSGGVDDPGSECSGGGTDPTLGQMCATEDDCGASTTCCLGICQLDGLCPVGPACESDDACEGDDICCPTTGRCLDRPTCVASGWCEGDGDCGDGVCCDGRCRNDRETCEGACAADADCGGETPYCCIRGDLDASYCAPSAGECWQYVACDPMATPDDLCPGEVDGSPLVCCGEAGSSDCRTEVECFTDDPCAGPDDCGGEGNGLICCDSDTNSNRDRCATPNSCYEGTGCGPDSPCPGGLFCCDRFQVDPELPGACFANEGTCNLGQPCAAASDCGEGAICCGDEFLEMPLCLQDDSGCMTPLP